MKVKTEFPNNIVVHDDFGIFMPDGTRLSARVWMPDNADKSPCPVILEHLPYRKRDGTIARDELTHPWFAGHGYVCIRTDMRGNGDSEGLMDDEYTAQELDDACHIISWAAAQPWCNGSVGMMGISWGGFNGLQTAALQPPALKAIITLCSTVDRYADDIHYKGGCMLGANFSWASTMLSYSSRPPDEQLVGDGWTEQWRERLNNQTFLLSTWLQHQHRDEYWQHGSICEDFGAIKAATLAIGGWHDGYRNTVSHLLNSLTAPVKGIMGPWIHKYPHFAGPKPTIGFLQEAKRWWDHWLKDVDNGVENDPDYRAYLMHSITPKRWHPERPGEWIEFQNWPDDRVTNQVLRLGPNKSLQNENSDLNDSISSPSDCGKSSGQYFPFCFSDELPDNQQSDDAASLYYDGVSPLENDLDLIGSATVQFKLSINKPVGQIAVRLCDLRPDGTSALIAHGFLNLTHRQSHGSPSSISSNESLEIQLDLDQMAYKIPAGHTLRLAISNAYFPFIWPAPEKSTITVLGGSLSLPVCASPSPLKEAFHEAEGAPPWNVEVTRKSSFSKTVETNPATGNTKTRIACDDGEQIDLAHGLLSSSESEEVWSIMPDDPLSATVEAKHIQSGGREGALWQTIATSSMRCDADSFYLKAKLVAELNGKPFAEKHFEDKIKRLFV